MAIDDLSFLLDALPGGALPIPSPPDGSVDPWTGQPLAPTDAGAIPPLAAPVTLDLEVPAAAAAVAAVEAPGAVDTAPALPAVTLADVAPAAPAGTPITREEVLALLSELDATIYLMV